MYTYVYIFIIVRAGVFFSNLGRKCIISEERFVLELPTSRAMLVTARPSSYIIYMYIYNELKISKNLYFNLTGRKIKMGREQVMEK